MRALLQRVKSARVDVAGKTVGAIEKGLLVFLGVGKGDSEEDADYLMEKVTNLRIFPDGAGKMNLGVREAGGSLLVVSQFTLYADCRRGRRPGFDGAAPPEEAERLYEYFTTRIRQAGLRVECGVFQAMMEVHLTNDGPVTIMIDSADKKTSATLRRTNI